MITSHRKALARRLLLVLALLFVVLGVSGWLISKHAYDMYQQHVTQLLNRDLAEHIASDMGLMKNGAVQPEQMKALAHEAMIINPSTEFYLLDREGNILSHDLPERDVLLDQVDLQPIAAFLSGQVEEHLIVGTDPRNPSLHKAFTAAPIVENGELQGYVYTVLGGARHDKVSAQLQRDLIYYMGGYSVVALFVFLFCVAGLIFYFLTRRLNKLIDYTERYREGNFNQPFQPPLSASKKRDEIDSLVSTFQAMAETIRNQLANLKAIDQSRTEMLANIAHDLKTPLASLRGYIETILIRYPSLNDDEKQQLLGIAHTNSKRLQSLSDDLFQLATLDTKAIQPKKEHFNLLEVIQDGVMEFSGQAEQRNIALRMSPESGEFTVYADIAMICRVIDNLLSNALKHTPDGGSVDIALSQTEHHISFAIHDSGAGIDDAEIPFLFDRFYRTEKSTHTLAGTGLGLAITKRIIELHKAAIEVKNDVRGGAIFTVSLANA